jgi:hypothetical protein
VDAGREWLEAQEKAHPALAAALADGEVARMASCLTRLWSRATEERVSELRASQAIEVQMHRSHVHRAVTGVSRMFVLNHPTFSTFLSQPLDGLQRWQSALRAW